MESPDRGLTIELFAILVAAVLVVIGMFLVNA